MFVVSVDFWKNLTEDELWTLAMDRTCEPEIRGQAMQRWLFPAKYGYTWSKDRVEQARSLIGKTGRKPENQTEDKRAKFLAVSNIAA
jgi:hypothetical protein